MNKSVYFITFHKTASSFFASYVLGRLKNLKQVDYLQMIYNGQYIDEIDFKEYGHVYGTLRLTVDEDSIGYKRVISKIINNNFTDNKKIIFFIRDPRAILVSYYFSMGWTHGVSPSEEIAERQRTKRSQIRQMTIDEYVLFGAKALNDKFNLMTTLIANNKEHILLRYEDMVLNFNTFYDTLSQFVSLEPGTREVIYQETRPQARERLSEHKRSGTVDSFRNKLQPETLGRLNAILHDTLLKYCYY